MILKICIKMIINTCCVCKRLSIKPICKECYDYLKEELFIKEFDLPQNHKLYYLSLYTGAMERVIRDYKFNANMALVKFLSNKVDSFIDTKAIDRVSTLFIPLPSSKRGEKERGFNQVEEILLHCNIRYLDCLILSNKHNASQQKKLNRDKRISTASGKFKVSPITTVDDFCGIKDVFVTDDIFTTGASVNEAIRVIKEFFKTNNIKINANALVIAKSGDFL